MTGAGRSLCLVSAKDILKWVLFILVLGLVAVGVLAIASSLVVALEYLG